ncbi:hypothetical protein LCGC14_3004700, partial [marine sediment metagenome]
TLYSYTVKGMEVITMDYKQCIRCNSENLKKNGRNYNKARKTFRQQYGCRDCGKKFLGTRQNLTKSEDFKYQNMEWVKTNWAKYTAAQVNEKEMLLSLAEELLGLITIKVKQTTGRPSQKIQDMLLCMLLKTYTGLSSRRLTSDLKTAKEQGLITKVPCYTTTMLYFNDKRLPKLLQELVHVSAIPLKEIEKRFAVDSSGFSTSIFGRWFDHRFNKETQKRQYRKCHIMIGTHSNIVSSIEITNQYGADTTQFAPLVKKTALHFFVKEISADGAYSSRKNHELVASLGGQAYIPFSKQATGITRGSLIWHKMFLFAKNNPQAFGEKYHGRSNVESTFHMIKTKFGDFCRSKKSQSQEAEILSRVC